MKRNNKSSYRLPEIEEVIIAHDSYRPRKTSKRLKPKSKRPARKKETE